MYVGIYFTLITVYGLQLSLARVTNKDDSDAKIVYPGPIQDLSTRYGQKGKNVTDPCAGVNFCTIKPDDYPEELFNKIFKGKYKEPVYQPTYIMAGDRQGDPDDVDNCETVVTYEPLYKVRSRSGEVRTVVQAPKENFLQMVRLETCKEDGGSCFTSFQAPVDLRAFCKQKYSIWEFLVHDGKEGTEKVEVDLPICCSCHYKATT